jgi:hypothetical protein
MIKPNQKIIRFLFIIFLALAVIVAVILTAYDIRLDDSAYNILLKNRLTKLGFGVVVCGGVQNRCMEDHKSKFEIWHFAHTVRGGIAENRFYPPISSADNTANFQGKWWAKGNDWGFDLKLAQKGNKLTGNYCAVAENGNKIDCDDKESENISGDIKDNVAKIKFISNFRMNGTDADHTGKAEITLKNGRLYWIVTKPTRNGYYYCPDKATLKRESK